MGDLLHQPSLEETVRLACLMEATAPKAGNIHPGASFADMAYADFVRSAEVISPILAMTEQQGVGHAILQAVTATQNRVSCNTNLGILLLLAPLCAVPSATPLQAGIELVLRELSIQDAEDVYRAIRIAQPGGMDCVVEGDVQTEPTGTLLEMMHLAATRDQVARQYATGFADIWEFGISELSKSSSFQADWKTEIVKLHLAWIAKYSDTHIIRKCGPEIGRIAQQQAAEILHHGYPNEPQGQQLFIQFDRWLREDNNLRNPGTSADLVTATLFAALYEGVIQPPAIDDILQSELD